MSPSPRSTRRGALLAGVVAMLAVLLIPLSVIAVLDSPEPELRVSAAWGRVSVLITDGDERLLIINTDDREAARALAGRLYRPWEPGPSILIAPADDRAAIGLWELVQRVETGSVLVAGVPGADPLWDAIERHCRARGIDLVYVTGRATVDTSRLRVDVIGHGPELTGERVVSVQRGGIRAVIALDATVPTEPANVLITGASGHGTTSDLVITSDVASRSSLVHEVIVRSREVIRVSLEPELIRIYGGSLREPSMEVAR